MQAENSIAFYAVVVTILSIVGAICLFLFGMKLMSEALQKVAGQNLRNFISQLAQNPLRGVLSGLVITAALQSSSATTVMVVGLCSANLLTFPQAFSLIMGANIGTTLKAWVISLIGYSFDLSQFALPIIALGFILLFAKKSTTRAWGEFFIGFALLFMGLNFLMSQSQNLTTHPEFIHWIQTYNQEGFSSVLIFVLTGFLLTAILQSSSAMLVFTFALATSGLITYENAAAMVIGENVGTTITANIAAIVGNYKAKRAALSHFIFNVSLMLLALIFFPFIIQIITIFTEWISGKNPNIFPQSIPFALSALHTLMNLLTTAIWINFIPQMSSIVNAIIPQKYSAKNYQIKYFNPFFISTSEFNLLHVKHEIATLASEVTELFRLIVSTAIPSEITNDEQKNSNLKNLFQTIQVHHHEISAYLQTIPFDELSREGQLRYRTMFITLERIQDIVKVNRKMLLTLQEKGKEKVWFSPKQYRDLMSLFDEVLMALGQLFQNLSGEYHKMDITDSLQIEERINKIRNKIKNKLPEKIEQGKVNPLSVEYYKLLIDAAENIGDLIMEINQTIAECGRNAPHY